MGGDLFSTVGLALRVAPRRAEDALLATPADQTVLSNLPPATGEEFLFAHILQPDASGPVPGLQGSTLERWVSMWDACGRTGDGRKSGSQSTKCASQVVCGLGVRDGDPALPKIDALFHAGTVLALRQFIHVQYIDFNFSNSVSHCVG